MPPARSASSTGTAFRNARPAKRPSGARGRAPGYHPRVARRQSPARLVIALSVAAVLVIFLVYTSLASGTPLVQPSELAKEHGTVSLAGVVVHPQGSARSPHGLRFGLRDFAGKTTVNVVYHG